VVVVDNADGGGGGGGSGGGGVVSGGGGGIGGKPRQPADPISKLQLDQQFARPRSAPPDQDRTGTLHND
jgi:hypothetical protein